MVLSHPLPYVRFDYTEDISMFIQDFIINYDKFSNFGYTLIVDGDYPEYLQPFLIKTYRFYLKKTITNKQSKLACPFHNKGN